MPHASNSDLRASTFSTRGTSATRVAPGSHSTRPVISRCASAIGIRLRARTSTALSVFGFATVCLNENVAGEPVKARSIALNCTRGPSRSFSDEFIAGPQRQHTRRRPCQLPSIVSPPRPNVRIGDQT